MKRKKYQKRIVSDFNNLLDKWKKIGFPYAKHFIDEKKIYNQLVDYAHSLDNKVKTFVIHDNQGLLHDRLREILNSMTCDGNHMWKEVDINDQKITHVDFAWVGATIGDNYLKYDKRIYEINTELKNLLEGGGVKGDVDKKDVIINCVIIKSHYNKINSQLEYNIIMTTNCISNLT